MQPAEFELDVHKRHQQISGHRKFSVEVLGKYLSISQYIFVPMYNSVRWELFKTDAQPEGEERTEGTRGLSIPAEKVLPDDSIF